MIRPVAAIVVALTLTPALLHAQDAVFTVTVASADVYKGPSNVTPVIGHVPRGTALPVSRNLGSWIRVPWPAAPDGVAYLYVQMGRLSGGATDASVTPTRSAVATVPHADPPPAPAPVPPPSRTRASTETRIGVQGAQGVTTISHVVGIGGLVHSMDSFGATGRAWRRNRLGLEFRLTRDATTSAAAAGRMTSLDAEPRVLYALFDHVSDYFWIRPYVGSGVSFGHHTLTDSSPAAPDGGSASTVGISLFGGSEVTFAGATRVGFSAEFGYRPRSTPFPGFETDRFSLSIAGHWYVK